jgi:hypothetical protein
LAFSVIEGVQWIFVYAPRVGQYFVWGAVVIFGREVYVGINEKKVIEAAV